MLTSFCKNQLPELIGVTGSPRFLSSVLGAASATVAHVDVCSIFFYDSAIRPAGFATASRALEEATRKSAERYVLSLGVHDPIRRTLLGLNQDTQPVTFRLGIEDIDHPAYREMNYIRTNTVERLSIAFNDSVSWYSINFYRKKESGRFRPDERSALFELAPLMSSLVNKHVVLIGQSVTGVHESPQERVRRTLRCLSPTLSDRECEICTLIVLGYSSEAISLKLGVSPNTVLTYRKRAYAKLKIGSQNELFRMCLESA